MPIALLSVYVLKTSTIYLVQYIFTVLIRNIQLKCLYNKGDDFFVFVFSFKINEGMRRP